jgi:hypothetical protein
MISRLFRGLALVIAGFVLIILGVILTASGPSQFRYSVGTIFALSLPFIGIALFLVGRVWIARSSPPPAVRPAGIDGVIREVEGDYDWVINTQRGYALGREQLYRDIGIVGILLFGVENVLFALVLRGTWSPSSGVVTSGVGLWFVAMLIAIVGWVNWSHPTSGLSPVRIGFNTAGLAVEYAPDNERRPRKLPANRPPLIAWSDVAEVSEMPDFSLGPPTGIDMRMMTKQFLQLWPISPLLVKRILEEGRERGLAQP